MKRTTIFIEEELERELKALAARTDRPMASLVREAVTQYVVNARPAEPNRLGFVAIGRSGRSDTAERHEQLLWNADSAAPTERPPVAAKGPVARRRGR